MSDDLLHSMLDNWRRWAAGCPGTYRSMLGRMYVPTPDEVDGSGEWVSKPKGARIPINEMQALKTERAILRLPRRPFDAPRLIVYHYLTPGHKFKQTCRRLGVKSYAYTETVELAHAALKRELDL